MKDYLAVSDVVELENKEIHFVEVLKIVLSDLELLKAQALKVRALALEEDHIGLIDSMEGMISNINKEAWFIRSMLK